MKKKLRFLPSSPSEAPPPKTPCATCSASQAAPWPSAPSAARSGGASAGECSGGVATVETWRLERKSGEGWSCFCIFLGELGRKKGEDGVFCVFGGGFEVELCGFWCVKWLGRLELCGVLGCFYLVFVEILSKQH